MIRCEFSEMTRKALEGIPVHDLDDIYTRDDGSGCLIIEDGHITGYERREEAR